MRTDANPFFKRVSESIESNQSFIKLFSLEILEIFKDNYLETINIIRSAPGGGKTTLLRLFTPNVLKEIIRNKDNSTHYKELYNKLIDLKIIANDKINIIGVIFPFRNEFSNLDYLEFSEIEKIRFFYSLLNSRLSLAILKAICQVKGLSFPNDLNKITISKLSELNTPIPQDILNITNGMQFYNWACNIEEKICEAIDSIFPVEKTKLKGHLQLFALELFSKKYIKINYKTISEKIIVMLDDVHTLERKQRKELLDNIIKLRPPVKVWVSERLEALSTEEFFSRGVTPGRDYELTYLEEFWNASRNKRFEKFSKSVANRRLESISDNEFNEFAGFLSNEFNEETNNKIENSLKIIKKRIKDDYGNKEKYRSWILNRESQCGEKYDQLIKWKSLEILLKRDSNKVQPDLDFGFELSEEELNIQDGSDVKNAAALFLNKEFNIPYYFGFSKLARLSSYNIEQFLSISGELFKDIISKYILYISNKNLPLEINPAKQESIFKKITSDKWKELSYKIPNAHNIIIFLDRIGEFCKEITHRPNAPISPGVNGIAISMSDLSELRNILRNNVNSPYKIVAEYISICIAYNLFEYYFNRKHNGREWFIFYLNKIYCIRYNLPLSYGGFQKKTIDDLYKWIEPHYQPGKELWNQ